MSFWTEQDVLEYLRLTGIPYASIYGDIPLPSRPHKFSLAHVLPLRA